MNPGPCDVWARAVLPLRARDNGVQLPAFRFGKTGLEKPRVTPTVTGVAGGQPQAEKMPKPGSGDTDTSESLRMRMLQMITRTSGSMYWALSMD